MQNHSLVAPAAVPLVATVRAVTVEQLAWPTPCSEFDVRRLLNHLLYWGPALEAAAKDAAGPAAEPSEQDADLTGGDWAADLEEQVDRIVTAWSEPSAWEGSTRMADPTPVPAALIGGMVLTEFVVHGWDLARATGRTPSWDHQVVGFVHAEVARTAEQGREMGIYGPRVPVPETAPVLDRTLGLTGRDPHWGA